MVQLEVGTSLIKKMYTKCGSIESAYYRSQINKASLELTIQADARERYRAQHANTLTFFACSLVGYIKEAHSHFDLMEKELWSRASIRDGASSRGQSTIIDKTKQSNLELLRVVGSRVSLSKMGESFKRL
ncbi:hypothetical protein YC2023_118259 [Brassica napus]